MFRFGTAVSGTNVHIVWGSRSRLERVPVGHSPWTWTWGDIYHLRSCNSGATWEKPVRLNQKLGTAMRPVVAASGRFVHVAWFDQWAAKQSPAWDWDIFVSHRFEVVCLDVNAQSDTQSGEARVFWSFDMQEKVGAFPWDAANGSPLIDGDLLYVQTSNGVDRNSFSDPQKEQGRKFPAPDAPNVIALDKRTGRLVSTDQTRITDNLLHGQWSSLCMGRVRGRRLLFFGSGDGCCYAFEALGQVPEQPVRLIRYGGMTASHRNTRPRRVRTGSLTTVWATSGSKAPRDGRRPGADG
jgi:hypothetical protein